MTLVSLETQGGGDYVVTSTTAGGIKYDKVYGFTSEDGQINCYLSKEYGFVKLHNHDKDLVYSRVP